MGRTMETTALFTLMSSSLVLKKAEEFYIWGCSPPCDYENVLAEKFILCCSDQEGPGPQYQMQVVLLSVTLVLPLKCGWPSTCISKCFGKEDSTVQGLGDGRGALKEPPSYKSKISILCYRIPIKEWYVKESILKAVQLQKHVPSMEQGGQEGWGKSLNGRYWCRSHTLSGANLAWSLGLHPCTTHRGHSKWGLAHALQLLFLQAGPGWYPNKQRETPEPQAETGEWPMAAQEYSCLEGQTAALQPAWQQALCFGRLASRFWSILNRLMLTLLYTFVYWLRMNNVNILVISVVFVLSINAVVTIRLSLLWLNHCYCFHVDYLKNNKIVTFLVILYS